MSRSNNDPSLTETPPHRAGSLLLCLGLALLSWLGMQIVHESGHVLGAWLTGGTVQAVVLHPLEISRTDVQPNPRPVFVVWLGPVIGVVVPCLIWLGMRSRLPRQADLFRFFAGFCLIANGAYLASGLWEPVGDARDLVHLGAPRWQLGLFALCTVPLGIWMWDGMANRFGLVRPIIPTAIKELAVVWGLLGGALIAELIGSPR